MDVWMDGDMPIARDDNEDDGADGGLSLSFVYIQTSKK